MSEENTVSLSEELAVPPAAPLPPPPARRRSIKDRFEHAKKEQQRVEEERLEKVKQKEVGGPTGKVSGLWNDAVANSKTNEAKRYQAKRRETISQFQTAEAVGIVANRVKQFEELYMQLAASIEKMEATIRAARRNAKKWKIAASTPLKISASGSTLGDSSNSLEEGTKIRIGETATFWLDPQYFSQVNAMLAANNNNPISLPTGVYSDESAPHIDVVAVCILDSVSNEPYLAVTVDFCEGQSGDPMAFGKKKIAVFARDHIRAGDDLVQIFSETFIVLSPDDRGITGFELLDSFDAVAEDSSEAALAEGAGTRVPYSESGDDLLGSFEGGGANSDITARAIDLGDTILEGGVGDSEVTKEGHPFFPENSDPFMPTGEAPGDTEGPDLDKTMVESDADGSACDQLDLDATLLDISAASKDQGEDDTYFNAADTSMNAAVDGMILRDVVDPCLDEAPAEEEPLETGGDGAADEGHGGSDGMTGERSEIGAVPLSPTSDAGKLVAQNSAETPSAVGGEPEDSLAATPSSLQHSASEADDFIDESLKSPLARKNRLKSSVKVGVVFSFSGLGSVAPEVRPPVITRADSSRASLHQQQRARRLSWDIVDERESDLPVVQKTKEAQLDLSKVLNISCSGSCCLVMFDSESGDHAEDGIDINSVSTLAITGTMRHAVFDTQMMVVDDSNSFVTAAAAAPPLYSRVDTVFEWVRDAAFSGWGYKWPMKRQKAGLRTKRFFILRNDLLSYHAREPRSKEEAHADYAMHSLRLRPGTAVSKTRRYLQDCLEVATPVDTLWFKSADKKLHNRWINLINNAVEHYSRGPVFVSKDRVECAWQHELPECRCIAVDAQVPVPGSYSRVSLFRVELEANRDSVDRKTAAAAGGAQSRFTFIIDYCRTGDLEADAVPLVVDQGIALTCVKLVGNETVFVGGSNGFVGVCSFGSSELMSRQYEGHSADAAVTCMASCNKRGLLLCGDDKGGVSLWTCIMREDLARCITLLSGASTGNSPVNAMQFIPHREFVAISTWARYLMVGLRVSPDSGNYELEGTCVLDINSLFSAPGDDASRFRASSFGGSDPTMIHCHIMAFPDANSLSPAHVNTDFGQLKQHTVTPPRSSDDGKVNGSIVLWKLDALISLGPTCTISRIECSYQWLDSYLPKLLTFKEFAQVVARKTKSTSASYTPPSAAGAATTDERGSEQEYLSRKVDYSVDFSIVHQNRALEKNQYVLLLPLFVAIFLLS